jgi:hypothetical protein
MLNNFVSSLSAERVNVRLTQHLAQTRRKAARIRVCYVRVKRPSYDFQIVTDTVTGRNHEDLQPTKLILRRWIV